VRLRDKIEVECYLQPSYGLYGLLVLSSEKRNQTNEKPDHQQLEVHALH